MLSNKLFSNHTGLSDSESDSSSLERKRGTEGYKSNRKPQTHKRRQKKRVAIPVATPKIPAGFDPSNNGAAGMGPAALMYQKLKNEINSSLEKGKVFFIKIIWTLLLC